MSNSLAGDLAGFLSSGHTPANALAAILTEVWEADFGVVAPGGVVSSWTGRVNGTVLEPVGTGPDYAADGTHFGGVPVVKCARTGSKVLTTGDLPAPLALENA